MKKGLLSRVKKGIAYALSAAMVFATVVTSNDSVVTVEAASAWSGDYYGFDLNYHEGNKCTKADGWSNGDMFRNCTWRAGNVNFTGSTMKLSITNDPQGKTPYAAGEYRSNNYFGFGRYDVRMKPIKNDGVVSSFFTYTGPSDGTVWDEIDIEFLGKDTTKVQFNYYTNGVGNHEYVYNLGFDASTSFHTYSFIWDRSYITWCVDGKAVYTATKNIPQTPGKIMMNAWAGVGVDDWLKPFNGRTGLVAEYDWCSYTSISKYNASLGGSSSNTQNTNNNNNNNNNYNNNNNNYNQSTNGLVNGKTYVIKSKNSGKALDVEGRSTAAGANVLQWDYSGGNNQKWILQQQSNGYYVLKCVNGGKVLDVSYASKDRGANIQVWDNNGGAQQQWKIEKVGDAYRIINVNSGKALDVSSKSTSNGGNIIQWDYSGANNQLWYFTAVN